jgi:hypothetical protein
MTAHTHLPGHEYVLLKATRDFEATISTVGSVVSSREPADAHRHTNTRTHVR